MYKEKKKSEVRKNKNRWNQELYWCPSQLWKYVVHGGVTYKLYARWRHSDPWSGYVVTCEGTNNKEVQWSEDLLSDYSYKASEPIENVQETLEKLFYDYVVVRSKTLLRSTV